jgi:hypothetical protein
MGVDSALGTEVVLRNMRAPLIDRERVPALRNLELRCRDAGHDVTLTTAQRAVAAPDVFQAILELYRKLNCATVTCGFTKVRHCASTTLGGEIGRLLVAIMCAMGSVAQRHPSATAR